MSHFPPLTSTKKPPATTRRERSTWDNSFPGQARNALSWLFQRTNSAGWIERDITTEAYRADTRLAVRKNMKTNGQRKGDVMKNAMTFAEETAVLTREADTLARQRGLTPAQIARERRNSNSRFWRDVRTLELQRRLDERLAEVRPGSVEARNVRLEFELTAEVEQRARERGLTEEEIAAEHADPASPSCQLFQVLAAARLAALATAPSNEIELVILAEPARTSR